MRFALGLAGLVCLLAMMSFSSGCGSPVKEGSQADFQPQDQSEADLSSKYMEEEQKKMRKGGS